MLIVLREIIFLAVNLWTLCGVSCRFKKCRSSQHLYLLIFPTQRKRLSGRSMPGKQKAAALQSERSQLELASDAESDGYGEEGLSWEAVLATVQVNTVS